MKETIIRFGSINFFRGFVDYFMQHILNKKDLYEDKIVIVQPAKGGKTEKINEQNDYREFAIFKDGVTL